MANRSSQGLASLVEERPVEALEHLDVAVRVVPLRGWLSLTAAFLSLGALAAFAFFYQVPLKVDGKGILLSKISDDVDPMLQVTAPASGRISAVLVKIGSKVEVGDPLAFIDQKELEDQVTSAESDLQQLLEEDKQMSKLDQSDFQSQQAAQLRVENALRKGIDLDQGRLGSQRAIASGDLSLNKRGMLSNIDTLKSKAATDELESKIVADDAHVIENRYNLLRDQIVRNRDRQRRKHAIKKAETQLKLLEERLERDSTIISPYEGHVLDLMITTHGPVEKGTAAVLLKPARSEMSPLEAIIFVPAGMGKKIDIGDDVEVSPDTIRRQEHGFIRGVIKTVPQIPCTDQAMLAELKHPALVASLVEKYRGQALLNFHVSLNEMSSPGRGAGGQTLNRYEWSSKSGREQWVSNGTPCSTFIVVERRPLIALAMPWFKSLIGYH